MQKWWDKNKTDFKLRLLSSGNAAAMFGASVFAGLTVVTPAILVGAMMAVTALGGRKKAMARELEIDSYQPQTNDPLYQKVKTISEKMGLDMPDVYVRNPRYSDFNAASWSETFPQKSAAVILSGTLFKSSYPGRPPVLNDDEQEAIIAHELTHIKRNDSNSYMLNGYMSSASLICVATAAIGAMTGILPVAMFGAAAGMKALGTLMNYAHQRQTETAVDEGVVALTGKPEAYTSALEKIEQSNRKLIAFYKNAADITTSQDSRHQWVAYQQAAEKTIAFELFEKLPWFHTHPSIQSRIAHINEITGMQNEFAPATQQEPARDNDDRPVLPPGTEQYRVLKTRDNGNLVIAVTSLSITSAFHEAASPQEEDHSLKRAFDVVAQQVLDDAEQKIRQDKKLGKLLP